MDPELSTDLTDYYARRAREYERIYEKPERQADLAQLTTRLRAEFQRRDVLEIACGTGYWTRAIADTARSVTATDVNAEVLRLARTKDWSGASVRFAVADAFDLHAVTGRFDAAFVGFLWSHLERPRLPALLDQLNVRLAPGSPVIAVDNRYVPGSSTPISRTDEHGDTFQVRPLDDGSHHEIRKNFPDERELRDTLAGLARPVADVHVELLDYFWLLKYQTLA
jgi:demethylmenaquinone methyltransferase/2-methoxy-6-polyprenyl-1,4-benzoquinol methylase